MRTIARPIWDRETAVEAELHSPVERISDSEAVELASITPPWKRRMLPWQVQKQMAEAVKRFRRLEA